MSDSSLRSAPSPSSHDVPDRDSRFAVSQRYTAAGHASAGLIVAWIEQIFHEHNLIGAIVDETGLSLVDGGAPSSHPGISVLVHGNRFDEARMLLVEQRADPDLHPEEVPSLTIRHSQRRSVAELSAQLHIPVELHLETTGGRLVRQGHGIRTPGNRTLPLTSVGKSALRLATPQTASALRARSVMHEQHRRRNRDVHPGGSDARPQPPLRYEDAKEFANRVKRGMAMSPLVNVPNGDGLRDRYALLAEVISGGDVRKLLTEWVGEPDEKTGESWDRFTVQLRNRPMHAVLLGRDGLMAGGIPLDNNESNGLSREWRVPTLVISDSTHKQLLEAVIPVIWAAGVSLTPPSVVTSFGSASVDAGGLLTHGGIGRRVALSTHVLVDDSRLWVPAPDAAAALLLDDAVVYEDPQLRMKDRQTALTVAAILQGFDSASLPKERLRRPEQLPVMGNETAQMGIGLKPVGSSDQRWATA
jgi:hypothetical protein